MRILITLACEDCKNKNYATDKNRTKTPDRLTKRKYCKACRKHTMHKESK